VNDPFPSFHAGIEQAAIKANQRKDTDSVHALADEVFSFSGVSLARLPGIAEVPLKATLEKAEFEYRHGKSKGVNEDDLIAFHNEIVTKLGAPDYAKIDRYQFDATRLSLAKYEPSFLGKDAPNGQEINRNMSPLQAAHILQWIVEQKLVNPYYQVPPGVRFPKFDRSNLQQQPDQGFFRAVQKSPLGAFDFSTVLLCANKLIAGGRQ